MGFYKISQNRLQNYLKLLKSIFLDYGLSKIYPDLFKIRNALDLWAPELNPKVNRYLEISTVSGLPAEGAYTRLKNEKKLYLNELQRGKLSTKRKEHPYYKKLLETPFPLRLSLELKLSRIIEDKKKSSLRIILDRFEIARGQLTRYTIDLLNKNTFWQKPYFELEDNFVRYSDNFRNQIIQSCQNESELAFLSLLKLEGCTIDSIRMGSVGPLWHQGNHNDLLKSIFQKYPDTFILNLPASSMTRALQKDKNLDPFSASFKEQLSANSREELAAWEKEYGLSVFKERRIIIHGSNKIIIKNILRKLYPNLLIRITPDVP
ncbi:MAG: hypothetical protein PF689_08195 [Deltaproteobacteria bacterium]|jgi:hypothetical protein|nr:hypothetical protein [Deltaproteobacteria bacterium]